MPGPAVVFREVHRLRRHAQDLQEQIDRVPRQLKAQQAKVARQEGALKEAQEAIRRLKVSIHDKDVSLKSTHTQIAKRRKQLDTVASKKEMDALQTEIAADVAATQRLEDEILACMTESEEKAAQLPELEKALAQAREEQARFEKTAAAKQADLTGQLNEALAQIKAAEAGVPEKVLTQYQRMVGSLGADALAALQGRTCSACHSEVTAQNYNEVLQELFVVCKSCGRILYLPE
ncbi:MAG TPA: C4-type zinc ribbon domain-containing protein [Gemmataceae bacterium]|nr:C4-type zinc ribbon domain-containing protein [Gemmataceae bacterium]